jgi:putative transposase
MPRISRGFADGHCYHILNRGNGRQRGFHKDDDYRAFINLLGETTKRYSIELFAYCLMPNLSSAATNGAGRRLESGM